MPLFPTPDLWLPHRISYGETDTMSFLYYAEYLHLFERARSAYIRQCGLGYGEIEKRDILLPVREAQCRYRHPAHYDELVQIRIAISEWGRASLRFVYEIRDEDKEKILASGMTQHAVITRSGKPIAVPSWLKEVLLQFKAPEIGEAIY
ncbi:MAG: acyl-CoA thioesterase [Desulfovibrio sp.]|nr:acyl-CoA thioesterase [Desulfovibrio sp.]